MLVDSKPLISCEPNPFPNRNPILQVIDVPRETYQIVLPGDVSWQ
jgi:hypothetical protein